MRRIILFAAFLITGLLLPVCHAYSGGSGTAIDPYHIATKADLLALAAATADYSKCFILTADISLAGETFTKAVIASDTTTGSTFDGTKFKGIFDGNNHSISNLNINTATGWYVGLFGYVDTGGQISNLNLVNVNVTGYYYVGGLCGWNYYGTIRQCHAAGAVSTTTAYVGGLCGYNSRGNLSQCFAAATVTGGTVAGGLCGWNTGSITQCGSTGSVSGTNTVGGLCGDNNSQCLISQCYASGAVTGSSVTGGLVGNNGSFVRQSYATGPVTASSTSVGGLCGYNSGHLKKCYAAGLVTGPVNYTGGLCGNQYGVAAKIIDSFWDIDTTGLAVGYNLSTVEPGEITRVFGKTTAEMMTQSTFTDAGWDFSNTDKDLEDWFMSGVEYPHLISEITASVPDGVGMMQPDAAAALVAANFQIDYLYSISDTVPAGQVISQSMPASVEIPCGSAITLTLSAGNKYAGSGTEQDPYLITGPYEFLLFAATPADYGRHVHLTENIDLGSFVFIRAVIAPDTDQYSSGYQGTVFTGHFDGNSHSISNLDIRAEDDYYIALFGFIGPGGRVSNLGLVTMNIQGYFYVGGLCADSSSVVMNRCYTEGQVTGISHTGGLCGSAFFGTISQCYSAGQVTGNSRTGGLCGYSGGSTISLCYSTAAVTANGAYVGGLCGFNHGQDNESTLSRCYATGAVTGNGKMVGGLCGYNNYGNIIQCYAFGAVTGNSDNVGGLCGDNYYGKIRQCYSVAAVSGTGSYVGGLCGSQYGNTSLIENSFWDTETSGLTIGYNQNTASPGIITNVVGKTTAQMQTVSTFTVAGWDFSNSDGNPADWFLSGAEYPHLIQERTVVVPDITGMMQEDVILDLVTANIQIQNTYITSNTIPAGQIISQSPAAGTEILCGSTLTLTVSWGVKYAGSGTAADPYSICNKYELLMLAATTADYGKYVNLMADIDLLAEPFTAAVFPGTWTGKFNGNGHLISNLSIKTLTGGYLGLFSRVGSVGQVSRLGLSNVNITGQGYLGGLCGHNSGTLYGSYVKEAALTGSSTIGMLCGYNQGTINQCYAILGTVTASSSMIGGLCGSNYLNGVISQCYAAATVTGSALAGGLCGYQTGSSASIQNSFWDTEVSGLTVGYHQNPSEPGTLVNVTGKPTAELMTESTFTAVGWDFTGADGDLEDWFMSGVDYPHLLSEISAVIPNTIGAARQDAIAALTSLKFQVIRTYAVSDTVPANQVISQSPAAGLQFACGFPVTLTLSLGSKYPGGGTAVSPYLLSTKYHLMILAATPADYASHFLLTADIDLADETFNTAVIAPDTDTDEGFDGNMFTGNFNGNGHVISNLNIAAPDRFYCGLFGAVNFVSSAGQVINLGLENVSITGSGYVGGLCGYRNGGTIDLCYTTGFVTGSSRVGGLCGSNDSVGILSRCYSTAEVVGSQDHVGGLCGYNYYGRLSQCYTTGAVMGGSVVGGLCGYNDYGALRQCYAAATVTGNNYVGGLCGSNSDDGFIDQCYAVAAVQASGAYVGGLCGNQSGQFALMQNSFWDIDTTGLLVGYHQSSSYPGTITHVIGMSTSLMQTLSSFTEAGWDFSNSDGDIADWFLPEAEYPRLIFEKTVVVPNTVGMMHNEVMAALLADNIRVQTVYLISDTIPAGHIISQSLPGGTGIPGGSTITLTVSLGIKYAGSGAAANPYRISSKYELMILAATPADYGSCFVLTNDIDLAGDTFAAAIIAPDTTVSSSFQGTKFTGIFDGNGHIISNMKLNAGTGYYIGLFGYIGTGGQVTDLGLVNVNVNGYYYVGSFCGYNSGSVSRCFSAGAATAGSSYLGGLCGRNAGALSHCYAACAVSGTSYVGGLCGSNNSSSTLSQCYSTGAVNGSSSIGGLCGSNSGTITNCFWDTQTSGRTTSAGGTEKTTAEMKTLSTFTSAAWDFASTWAICEGTNYPRLHWQIPAGDFACPDGVGMEELDVITGCWLETVQFVSDINDDDTVNLADYMTLSKQWMLTGCDTCGGADMTGDGNVDGADLTAMAEQWLRQANAVCQTADLDADGRIDLADYAVFAGHWLEM